MNRQKNTIRKNRGSFIAEAPFALWALFFLFTFPFLDMATILLRYTFFVSATRDGVHAASHAKTFVSGGTSAYPSATTAAPAAVNLTASSFREITISTVRTRILRTNIATQVVTIYGYNQALTTPADDSTYLYEVETTVTGLINPLINMNIGILGTIPGLTSGVPVTVSAREFCEFPQGLNL